MPIFEYPIQSAPAGGAGVTTPGTAVAGQVAFFTAPTVIGGDPGMTYDPVTDKLTVVGSIDPMSILLSGGTALFFESNNGATAPVSGAATGRIRYNDVTGTWQTSTQGGLYTDFGSGTVGPAVAGQVAFFTAPTVIGGDADFTYSAALQRLVMVNDLATSMLTLSRVAAVANDYTFTINVAGTLAIADTVTGLDRVTLATSTEVVLNRMLSVNMPGITGDPGDFVTGLVGGSSLQWLRRAALTNPTLDLYETGGTLQTRIALNVAGVATVFNEQGFALNFRIEGDTDPNTFFLEGSTDRVGIGTATPGVKLDVTGDIQASGVVRLANGAAATPSLAFTNSLTTGLFRQAADSIGVAIAGVEAYRIDASSNLTMRGDFDFTPSVDNQGELGTDALRWNRIRGTTIVSGDLSLINDDGSANWTIKEGVGKIEVVDNVTNKRYEMVLREVA